MIFDTVYYFCPSWNPFFPWYMKHSLSIHLRPLFVILLYWCYINWQWPYSLTIVDYAEMFSVRTVRQKISLASYFCGKLKYFKALNYFCHYVRKRRVKHFYLQNKLKFLKLHGWLEPIYMTVSYNSKENLNIFWQHPSIFIFPSLFLSYVDFFLSFYLNICQ